MKITSYRDRFLTAVTLLACLLLVGAVSSCNHDDESTVVLAAASCVTYPGGNSINISQGDMFSIVLAGWVPCTGGGGEIVLCGPASFHAEVNQSRFFSAGTFDDWSPGAMGMQRRFGLDTRSWTGSDHVVIEVTSDQTGTDVLARCDFKLTVSLASPELSSPAVALGGSTCSPSLSIQWVRPTNSDALAGYSYSVVNQDDPNYDTLRSPDTTVDLGPDITTFTTPPLDAGEIWEFNLLPIDTSGGSARFYSSFWASIEACDVVVTWPRDGDSYARGEWVQVSWELPILWGGDDVGGAYQVATIELLEPGGNAVILSRNHPNTGNNGFAVPSAATVGSGYQIRITLNRVVDIMPELPLELIGLSGTFSVT